MTRYFFFQPDGTDPRVCAFESKQSRIFSRVLGFLCQGRPRLDTAVQVVCYYIRYNLASTIPSDRPELGETQDRIALLSTELSMNFNDTFVSKRTHCDTGDGLRRGEHVYEDRQVVDAFTRVGFTLGSNDEDENGWAPLNQVKQPSTLSVNLNR